MRLDNYLVDEKLADSRTKAQMMIKNSFVSVNGELITKSSFKVEPENDRVTIKEHKQYVSRSAHKLDEFLKEIDLDIQNSVALDIGSSTGGFTQVLLEYGASEVTAVDVGTDQLHKSLKDDSRVHSYESCDIRAFESDKLFEIVVSDVAFISLFYILDDVHRLSQENIILLFKPQFEVGREAKRDKNGVVVDKRAIANAMQRFEDACLLLKWDLVKKSPSQLTGKDGNLEYCYYYKK
ncbi:TlyA family rRNA (cytidine-2'-O)-methyltransferase [Sulfurimonas aquatica]|uniref:TlyA family rRNA (Cytidine-2'-O)-methyltransferase n=1 Tax=Sulfurimonas aquatica TaxID=2672570 RepID=A0A975B0Q7_9BACT|nr:TlyA family RNA methyltransferase [Sulfurimonas aquatica]QSZ42092.1 TlyA family rRNA (cytidine-2'-O)-methyltransferase [Sulfurimonas aquatica]